MRFNGRVYEALVATIEQRRRCDLYHSALEARTPDGRFVIEMAPVAGGGDSSHGAVAGGAVGSPLLGWSRLFRYEIRCWRDGRIPDVAEAVESPRALSDDPALSQRILDSVPLVPTPTWGRDELRTGEMWNSNSLISCSWSPRVSPSSKSCLPRGQGTRMGRRHCRGDASARAAFARPTGRGEDMTRSRVLASGAGLVALAAVYRRFLRRPILNWGAYGRRSKCAVAGRRAIRGSRRRRNPSDNHRRSGSAVWPWIAQMGPAPRGGAYTYDWVENLLGLDMHSADRVLARKPGSAGRRHARLRQEPHALRARRAGARASRPDPKTATGSGDSCSTSRTEEPG